MQLQFWPTDTVSASGRLGQNCPGASRLGDVLVPCTPSDHAPLCAPKRERTPALGDAQWASILQRSPNTTAFACFADLRYTMNDTVRNQATDNVTPTQTLHAPSRLGMKDGNSTRNVPCVALRRN